MKTEKVEKANPSAFVTPEALASRLGIGQRKLRSILRAAYPREAKGKKWEIPIALADKVEKAYKAKVRARQDKPQDQTKKELESG